MSEDREALLGHDQMLKLLDQLALEAEKEGVRVELFVVGGGAMALAYNVDRVTGDLDAVFEPKSSVANLAKKVAASSPYDLSDDWLNDGVKGFLPGPDSDATVFLDHPFLSVSVASPRYLFVLKAMSARESDHEDLEVLYPLCRFKDADEALDLVAKAYPANRMKPVTQYLIEGIAQQDADSGPEPKQRWWQRLGRIRKQPFSAETSSRKSEQKNRYKSSNQGAVWVPGHTRNGKRVSGYWRKK